ncbi:MAG: serine/threonine protein kinase [Coriobacteriales bacterium]|nr:serine/threonine protein kinase [Coriobacteriales bacterium]
MPAGLLLGRYRLTETAGHGGFATVEVAWDTRLQRRVAVKRIALRNSADPTARASLREARTAALLNDANIVNVLDFEVTATEALIIMEYIEGPSLVTLLRNSSTLLDLPSIAAITRDVGNALIHAHENQVLHLDIKPANILFDLKGNAKVTDFGMASLSARVGFAEPQGGTVGYMPPEQIEGQQVDERTDLWALAILIYQLLVGNNPYLVADAEESLRRIETVNLPLPSQVRNDLNPAIDLLFISALSAEPAWRQSSIKTFVDALLPYLGNTRSGRAALRRRVGVLSSDNQIAENSGQLVNLTVRQASQRPAQDQFTNVEITGEIVPANALWPVLPAETRTSQRDGSDYSSGSDRDYSSGSDRSDSSNSGDGYNHDDEDDDEDEERSSLPLWWRLSPRAQAALTRLLAALACVSTAFVGISGFGLLGLGGGGVVTGSSWRPVGGSIESTISYTPVELTASEFQLQLIVLLGILALIAIVALIAPTLGAAVATLTLVAGFWARGLVFISILLAFVLVIWWLLVGRRGVNESIIMALTMLLTCLFAPFCLPLLAGGKLRLLKALGTTGASWFLILFLSGLTRPLIDSELPGQLFSAGFILERASHQFPPAFWTLLNSPTSWLSLLTWLLACACMVYFSRNKKPSEPQSGWRRQSAKDDKEDDPLANRPSRLKLMMGAVLATFLLLVGLLVVPFSNGELYLTAQIVGLSIKIGVSFVLISLLILTGVLAGCSETAAGFSADNIEQ